MERSCEACEHRMSQQFHPVLEPFERGVHGDLFGPTLHHCDQRDREINFHAVGHLGGSYCRCRTQRFEDVGAVLRFLQLALD